MLLGEKAGTGNRQRTKGPHLGDRGRVRSVEDVQEKLALVGHDLLHELNLVSLIGKRHCVET